MMSGPNSPNLNPLDYQVRGQCWSLNKSCNGSDKMLSYRRETALQGAL